MIKKILTQHRGDFGPVINLDYRNNHLFLFDLTKHNEELLSVDLSNAVEFSAYVEKKLNENHTLVGIGKYMENRTIYDHSDVFSGEINRTIHLGIDLWVESGVEVICPCDARIHSFANNPAKGDYGPTLILEHELEGQFFYTLYGHLSLESIQQIAVGDIFSQGDIIGRVGSHSVNGSWPPHLHFQIISKMGEYFGDYPGVCSINDVDTFKELCPDPNLILRINGL